MTEIEEFILRRSDFSLSEEQTALRDAFESFFQRNCVSERVRKAEPLGWDAELWAEMAELRPVAMGVPQSRGGDDAGLAELALVTEQAGRRAAPVPLVETMVAARLLASVETDAAADALDRVLAGEVASVVVGPASPAGRLVPAGAVATTVLGLRGDSLVMSTRQEPPPPVRNLACAPLAWWHLADGVVLASGDQARSTFARAQREWRVLTAAALVGVGASALDLAVQYAKDRRAFGVPIGSFQSIAHPLADVLTGIECARRLTYKAAWFADHEPGNLGPLATMAFVQAAEAAEQSGSVAIHTQGGFGFTLESDVQLYFRRAKGWALIAGDRRQELQGIADELFGPVRR
ncbi:acyl-CoA dehydrogenase family protein [Frankia gtarii]|uniref:acyl-CoA dehydrogenase family protein n=1 Tax=Frankia gtarii TaxID=2950102 RepID=UPI0021BF2E37|nr:acyl-CoA dehydrogenase [Frankia gtarii]